MNYTICFLNWTQNSKYQKHWNGWCEFLCSCRVRYSALLVVHVTTLSASRPYNVDDRMVNEGAAVGMRIDEWNRSATACNSERDPCFKGSYRLRLQGLRSSQARNKLICSSVSAGLLLSLFFDPEDRVICYSETPGFLRTTRCYTPGDRILHNHSHENFKSNVMKLCSEIKLKPTLQATIRSVATIPIVRY
jgi:hypothetical protein